MNSENNPNVNASGTTSPGAPQKQPQPQQPSGAEPQGDAKKQLSEADYLAREQAQASAAISAVLTDMKRAVAQGVDVREWTRQHPLIMAGTATVAGFVAGMLVTPSKKETFKDFFGDKWEAFKEKMTPPATAAATVGNPPPAAPQGEPSSILGTIIKQAIQVLGPALGGMITGAMAGEAEGAKNGHPDGPTHSAPETATRNP
jgi:ElaB/YqjD/DUF883 family membrane-anchored ribosome-binding protein